jgi:hypothetical protein
MSDITLIADHRFLAIVNHLAKGNIQGGSVSGAAHPRSIQCRCHIFWQPLEFQKGPTNCRHLICINAEQSMMDC